MTSTEDFGLSDFGHTRSSGYEEDGRGLVHNRRLTLEENGQEPTSLPRADGGRDAWLFLAGCFAIEALTWGKSRQALTAFPHHYPTSLG